MKTLSVTKLSDTLQISEHPDGFWLYDSTRGMNLSMRAKTRDEAFTEALTYYQKRFAETEKELNELTKKVNAFVGQFVTEDDDEER